MSDHKPMSPELEHTVRATIADRNGLALYEAESLLASLDEARDAIRGLLFRWSEEEGAYFFDMFDEPRRALRALGVDPDAEDRLAMALERRAEQ